MLHEIIGGLLSNAGVRNEIEYWSKYSSGVATSASAVDHMSNALGTIGFYGHPRDAFNKWAGSLGSNGVVDNLIGYFSNATLAAFPIGTIFYKDFTNTSTVNADFSVGSNVGTFTRTASNCTYIDSNGVIQLVTDANIPRYQGGYYDATGFHSGAGLLLEAAATNLLIRTDGTSSAGGLWTGWTNQNGTGSTVTLTQADVADFSAIPNSYAQRVQLSGQTCTNKALTISSPVTTSGTLVHGVTVTGSFYARTRTTTRDALNVHINEFDANGVQIYGKDKNSPTFNLTTEWKYYTYTVALTRETSAITGFSDSATSPGEKTTVLSEGHALVNGQVSVITGTTTYNGTFTISNVTANTFDIEKVFVGGTGGETGTTTTPCVNADLRCGYSGVINTGDVIDFEFYAPQLTISPNATSFIPTTTAAATRNKDVLKFPTSGNLNASAQTLFIKWSPVRTPVKSGGAALFDTSVKSTKIKESANGARHAFYPNITDSDSCVVGGDNSLPINTPVTYTLVSDNSASKSIHARFFINGSPSSNTPTDTDNFTSPAWGEYFYIGCDSSEANHHSAVIHKIVIFKRELSSTEITNVYNNL